MKTQDSSISEVTCPPWDTAPGRRELARQIVLEIADQGREPALVIEELKQRLGHDAMSPAQRNRFAVLLSDVRTIAGAWTDLSYRQRLMFAAGTLVPSALARSIRQGPGEPARRDCPSWRGDGIA